jgi:hypothetical protein
MLPLLALFVLLAAAHSVPAGDPWGGLLHVAACGAGLVLLAMLSPRLSRR